MTPNWRERMAGVRPKRQEFNASARERGYDDEWVM
jgi:hypothetical protein